MIRGLKCNAPILATQHPTTVRSQQHMVRIRRVDIDIVHDNVRPGHRNKGHATIDRLVQTLSRTGINRVQVARVLHQLARPTRTRWKPLQLILGHTTTKQIATIHTLVDP